MVKRTNIISNLLDIKKTPQKELTGNFHIEKSCLHTKR